MKLRGAEEEGDPWQDDFDDAVLEDDYDSDEDDMPYRTVSQRQTDYYDRAAEWRGQVSCRDFYAFHLHDRPLHHEGTQLGERDTLFYAGRAFQEYLIMAYAKIENQRVGYLHSDKGQKKLRAEQYDQLLEAIRDPTSDNVGRRIVLPSTYNGSPRDMNARYHDAMAIVRQYGKVMAMPSLCICEL